MGALKNLAIRFVGWALAMGLSLYGIGLGIAQWSAPDHRLYISFNNFGEAGAEFVMVLVAIPTITYFAIHTFRQMLKEVFQRVNHNR